MAHLSIDVLGELQILLNKTPVLAFESKKVNALLAYLAVESDRPHRRENLVGLLWPDYPEESARHNLRQALYNLRLGIGDITADPSYLFITRNTIQFNCNSDYSLDLDLFNQNLSANKDGFLQTEMYDPARIGSLEEITKLYRGEFLQNFSLEDSSEFEEWIFVWRENLHQRALDIHSNLTKYFEVHGNFTSARQHALRQLELDPWREEAHRQMMRILALRGERSAALAQYDACKQVLAKELDVEPSIETRELYEQIRLGILNSGTHLPISISTAPLQSLPVQLTPFIGRELELIQLNQLINDPGCRCISLVGPGGIGKTRLALKAAEDHTDEFAQGIVFIPFASVGSPAGIIPIIINTLNINYYGPGEPKDHLITYLRDKEMLLILDNIEHLLAGGYLHENITQLVIEILQNAPRIKLLITSREALDMQGEWIFEVQGLGYPKSLEAEGLDKYDAITLFVQRARRITPGFSINDENCVDIARISQIVEGMPLAIELAATWMRTLSPREITAEIVKNIDFLSATMKDLPERHRSMRVVFDFSWQMLSIDEQNVLSKLSVFNGGFEREAAEKVADATLSTLSTLVNRTLIRRTSIGRYELHELVRQYCKSQLATDLGLSISIEERHCTFYLALAESADLELQGGNQLNWLSRIEKEHGNLRRAFEWALENDAVDEAGNEIAFRLSGALRWYWRMRGHFHEGIDWLSEALQHFPERITLARARVILGLGLLTNGLGNLGAATEPIEASVIMYREMNDQKGLAEALMINGLTLLWQGDAINGREKTIEALEVYRSINDWWGEAQALYRLGSYLADYGGASIGKMMLEESATILEDHDEKYLYASVLVSLGIVDLRSGEYSIAQKRFEHSLATARAIRHPWGIADVLTNLGCLYRIRGDYDVAQHHFEEALRVYREHGQNVWEIDVFCAMAENAIVQGKFSTAHKYLQAANSILTPSQNKLLQSLVWYLCGFLEYYEGNLEQASKTLEEAIRFTREGQFMPDLARSLLALGWVRLKQGNDLVAIKCFRESLGVSKDIGQMLGIVVAFEALGSAYTIRENDTKAVILFSVSEKLRQRMGAPVAPIDLDSRATSIALLRNRLGEALFSKEWVQGKARGVDEIMEEILAVE